MKLQKFSSSALGVLATSISFGDVTSVSFDQPLSWDMTEVTSHEKVSIPLEVEAETVEANSTTKPVVPPAANKWDEVAKKEFLELAKKHALEVISPVESTRFERLKVLRRHENPTRTFAEIQADIEFHRNIESAIQAIQRLMNNGKGPYFASA